MKSLIRNARETFLSDAICEVRGQKVMLDSDLARIYGVATKRLNEQVKRNRGRFPSDFCFRLTRQEYEAFMRRQSAQEGELHSSAFQNRSQNATGSQKHRDPRSQPYAFTEHGAIMAANVLNSRKAVQMSVFVVRAFARMRSLLGDSRNLARKLAALEDELKKRLNVHESAIVDILQRVMEIIDPPAFPEPQRVRIGFRQKED